ncbi:MAG: choloylglycine hydrolase, partial [Halothiobacillus sp. 13-55-115]
MNRTKRATALASIIAGTLTLGMMATTPADACTRMIYHGLDNLVMTGRSMDWRDPIPADMWIFPRGMTHDGGTGPRSVHWTSKYGSLLVTSFGIAASDGMNEKGLVANLLWLAGSDYPKPDKLEHTLSIAAWAQYFLD